jgi:hypothetical protein
LNRESDVSAPFIQRVHGGAIGGYGAGDRWVARVAAFDFAFAPPIDLLVIPGGSARDNFSMTSKCGMDSESSQHGPS